MEYLTHIIAFFAGLGAGWTLKIIVNNQVSTTTRKTSVTQRDITAGGDVIGGDVNKHRKG